MHIAVCLRGISYLQNYYHKYGLPPYTIDFRDTSDSILKNIIDPLRNQGHEVDVYLYTYHSAYEHELEITYQPVKTIYKDYQPIPLRIAQTQIGEPMLVDHHIDCIDMIQDKKYDHVIITRFDLYFYKNILEVGIDWNTFNYSFVHMARSPQGIIFSSEDNFVCYPYSKNKIFKECLLRMKQDKQSTHLSGKYLIDSGERVKYLFGEKGEGAYDYPFYKFGRHIFGEVKEYHLEHILTIPMNRLDSQAPNGLYFP